MGKAQEKRLLHPSLRGEGWTGGREKSNEEDGKKRGKKSSCEQRGRGAREGMERGERVGALLTLTPSHAGLPGLFPFLRPGPENHDMPRLSPLPALLSVGPPPRTLNMRELRLHLF